MQKVIKIVYIDSHFPVQILFTLIIREVTAVIGNTTRLVLSFYCRISKLSKSLQIGTNQIVYLTAIRKTHVAVVKKI